jgi:hypothetical protein
MNQINPLPKRPHSTALDFAENIRCHHAIRADAEHTLEDVLHPAYFWVFHERIKKGDLIEISHELHHFWGLFYIVGVDPETASVLLAAIHGPINLRTAPVRKADLDGAYTKLRGVLRWCVMAKDDTSLKTDLPTRVDAEEWLAAKRAETAGAGSQGSVTKTAA